MKILAFSGSPRRFGNSVHLLNRFLAGAIESGATTEIIYANGVDIKNCRGCLRCNLLQKCVIRNDDWPEISVKILEADAVVFASPVYFHHLAAPLKNILDRFRSFIHVQITATGLIHTPWQKWNKKFILLLSQGSPDEKDAMPIVDLFKFLVKELGHDNSLQTLIGSRLAIENQIVFSENELIELYPKLKLPVELAHIDCIKNQQLLAECYSSGITVGSNS